MPYAVAEIWNDAYRLVIDSGRRGVLSLTSFIRRYLAQVAHLDNRTEYIALYALVRDDDGEEGIEVLVDQNSSLT